MNQILFGDCRETMRQLIAQGVKIQTCVTSPPYFGLRNYGVDGQLGLESTVDEYVQNMVEVFRLVRDLLADDGTLWLNLGDSYSGSGRGQYKDGTNDPKSPKTKGTILPKHVASQSNLKPKDLIGIPWRVAFALQADGWYLRQDIIWHKPNPMPESITDRCTKSHEYIFLLSKSPRYFFDNEAISEPVSLTTITRLKQNIDEQLGSTRVPGKNNGNMKAVVKKSGNKVRRSGLERGCPENTGSNVCGSVPWEGTTRNKRSVWTVTKKPYKGAHFATFPADLIYPCVIAGSRENDIVFDPFMGSGTTAQVAIQNGRQYLGCELNPEYESLQNQRLAKVGAA